MVLLACRMAVLSALLNLTASRLVRAAYLAHLHNVKACCRLCEIHSFETSTRARDRSHRFLFAQLDHVRRSFWLTVSSPSFHELAALFQRITAAVGLFGLVADDMRQCGLGGFAGEVGDIASPTPEETETPNCFRLATTGSHLKNALLPQSHGLPLENPASCIRKFNSTAVGGRYKATGMENLR